MILCCGDALIDMLPRRLPSGEETFLPAVGGAIFNTAVGLGRLGEETGLFCGLSLDMFGRKLLAALDEAGVDHSLCVRSRRPSALAFVALKDGQARYAFHDENTAGRMLTVEDLPVLPAHISALQLGGISLASEPCGSAYEALGLREHAKRVIALDPNVRPNVRPAFASSQTAYRERLERLVAVADIVKISDEDLAWLAPGRDFDDVAGEWLAGASSLVVMTRGAKGATARTAKGEVDIRAIETKVVDTVGAGDSFNAGLLAGLRCAGVLDKKALRAISGSTLEAALDLAARVAAATVSRAGANPPWRHEIGA